MIGQTMNRIAGIRALVLGTVMVVGILLAAQPAHASTTFTVNSTEDNSDALLTGGVCDTGYKVEVPGGAMVAECTLRAAIQQANFTTGADTIEFDIPASGVQTIAPASALPKITGPVSINGYSQPGSQPNTKAVGSDAVMKIMLSGAKTVNADGLVIGASNSTVKGLVINGWQGTGVRIDGAGANGNRIAGNFIGTDASGATVPGNYVGVRVYDGSDNTIGGTTAAARNLISGNGDGVYIGDGGVTKANKVVGNYIGTDATGTRDLGNVYDGVGIEDASGTTDTIIGGTTAAERNVISANGDDGISIYGGKNRIAGNFIGTDATGTEDLGNTRHGVYIASGENNTVGGATSGERNVISGNDFHGVRIEGVDTTGTRVLGNYIGTDKSGTERLGNTYNGVGIKDAPGNTVGGTTAGARNVISGNYGGGISVFAGGNKVIGNYIGTDATGTEDLGNYYDGVYIYDGRNNAIGGSTSGARNVISGNGNNGGHGVRIVGSSTGNRVLGNYIGTDKSGTKDLGNTENGVLVGAPDNAIGGTTAGEGNVISANGFYGVQIYGSGATGNRVQGNFIGTDRDGAALLGNTDQGVWIINASNNTVGGTVAAARNVISGNDHGVEIESDIGYSAKDNRVLRNVISRNERFGVKIGGDTATGNRVLSNSIFANGLLGIDLGSDGVSTPNDPDDADTGANGPQNFPVLSSAKKSATGTTTVRARLDSTPNATFTVQFFSNPAGTDEGKKLLGQKSVTTDANGDMTFSFTTKQKVSVGQSITATATGAFGTSEFSAPRSVVAS